MKFTLSSGPVGLEPTTRGDLVGVVAGRRSARLARELRPLVVVVVVVGGLLGGIRPGILPGQGRASEAIRSSDARRCPGPRVAPLPPVAVMQS